MIPYSGKGSRWIGALVLSTSSIAIAQTIDIPLRNWTVPSYREVSPSGGITTMTDITQGIGFVGVAPCRLVDTRSGSGFPSGYGPPSLSQGIQRNFDLNSQPNCTGIPDAVKAYSLNFTVTNTAGIGFLLVWPQGGTQPNVSSINYVGGQTLANAVIVPAGTGGGISVIAGVSGTDLLIDINGYFTDTYNSAVQFVVSGNVSAQGAIAGTNSSTSANSYGIRGQASGTGTGSAGVYGLASATSGTTFGVFGKTSSTPVPSNASAGVKGADSGGELSTTVTPSSSGVRGDSVSGVGVAGFSRATGVSGTLLNTGGAVVASGYLGYSVGNYGVYALGDLGATGMKFFVEPHPTEAGKVVRFVALEGPEAGTYFRGTARTVGGTATIEVPESFRIVTDEEGLTVQLTVLGSPGSVWVATQDLSKIVVRALRDVAFHYHVFGVRRAFRAFEPIVEGREFVPGSQADRIPEALPEESKRRLVANGTYNPDGTINLTTAERLGWTQLWRTESH
jgi:hypothetical protein